MISASALAKHVVWLAAQGDEPVPLTQLMLHKLLYYSQAGHLAIFGRRLLNERFEAWRDGPVLVALRPEYRDFGYNPIPYERGVEAAELPASSREFLSVVWHHYRRYSGPQLSKKTHRESPWILARGGLPPDAQSKALIDEQAMASSFIDEFKMSAEDLATARAGYELADRPAGETYRIDPTTRAMERIAS